MGNLIGFWVEKNDQRYLADFRDFYANENG